MQKQVTAGGEEGQMKKGFWRTGKIPGGAWGKH